MGSRGKKRDPNEYGIEPEVDFVLTIGSQRVPLEVKYRRRIDPHEDTRGLRSFVEKAVYNAPFGVLVTRLDGVTDDKRARYRCRRSLPKRLGHVLVVVRADIAHTGVKPPRYFM